MLLIPGNLDSSLTLKQHVAQELKTKLSLSYTIKHVCVLSGKGLYTQPSCSTLKQLDADYHCALHFRRYI